MDTELTFLAILAVALLCMGGWRWIHRGRNRWARLPGELRRAELVYSERLFRAREPDTISAKVDRAYRRRDGVFVLLELKTRTRARHYHSDVIGLSAQRLALGSALGVPVAAHAYVLVQAPDERQLRCQRVRLLSEQEVLWLVRRRRLVLDGVIEPLANGAPHLCGACAQRRRCGR